jgi:two-component system sensor histidine kinase/response regulator
MRTILIVDDMLASREALMRILNHHGYETIPAMNGAEALALLKKNKVDLILLDQMMPEVDGLTFLAGIRRFPKWKSLPVVMFTGVKDRSCVSRAQVLDVKEFLVKVEYDPRELIGLIEKHLNPDVAGVAAAAPSFAGGSLQ